MIICVRKILRDRAFTILELMVVVIIVGILATLSVQHMFAGREMALEREAISNLKLIVAAEKIYRLETESYISLVGLTAINQNLNLAISNSTFWNYKVELTGGGTGISARAQRNNGAATTFCLDQTQINETKGCTY